MVVASRRITNRRTKNWWKILKVWNSNLLEPSMSSVFNPYKYIRRYTLTHTYCITARFTESKNKTSVLQSSSSSPVNCPFLSAVLSSISLLGKLPWRRKLFTVFVIIRQDQVFFREVPDSIILYYDSRCWYNTVSVEKYCNTFH